MKLRVPCAVLGAALVLAVGVSTAEAAKGVKKNGATAIYGEVASVNHAKAAGGNAAAGSFLLKTARNHKKHGVAGNNVGMAGGRNQGHEFHVTNATQFEGPNRAQASFASLQQGERVHVRAQGQQAQNVQIASNRNRHGRYRGMRHLYGTGRSNSMVQSNGTVQRHNQQHSHVRHATASHARSAAAHHKSKK